MHIWKKTSEIIFSPIFLFQLLHQIYSFATLKLFFSKSNTGLFLFLIPLFSTQITSTQPMSENLSLKFLLKYRKDFWNSTSVSLYFIPLSPINTVGNRVSETSKNLRFYNTHFHLRTRVKLSLWYSALLV